jgi:predicted transcriptional regulator of viral defense system
MNAREALGRLRSLQVPAATTAEAAAVLGLSIEAASHTLRRLAASGLVTAVRKGLWSIRTPADPFALAAYVTLPHLSYISLQTALFQRGMISQIPTMIYLVSLGRSGRVATSVGTYSVHHVQPEIFGGFETVEAPEGSRINLAFPEKALIDFLYLSSTRDRLFASLPELDLPPGFRRATAREWIRRIPHPRRRTLVERRLAELLDSPRIPHSP